MRIAFLVSDLDGLGGTSRTAITQANALVADHEVRLISVARRGQETNYDIDPRVAVDHLTEVLPDQPPAVVRPSDVVEATALDLAGRPSLLVPPGWDPAFSALTDVALEACLPRLDVDVLVTVTPALLAAAAQLAPRDLVLVHQEHHPPSPRSSVMECLLAFAPRADVVACPTADMATWLEEKLGDRAPEIVVVPNALPPGFIPQSRLDQPLIVAAGPLSEQQRFVRLIRAFGQIADRIPEWRLRILGEGDQLGLLRREARRSQLWDRVEVPGATGNVRSEWARASISALTARDEGLPLVVHEAMAAGVPVASFDTLTGPRDLIEHEVNGLLVPAGSEVGMAAALLRLATDEPLRRRLGDAARESVSGLAPEAIAHRWVEIFGAALERRSGPRLTRRAIESAGRPDREPAAGAAADVEPATVREAALAGTAAIASKCGDGFFVLPPDGDSPATVVLPIGQRDRFLADLAGADLPSYLSLVDPGDPVWPVRRGEIRHLATDLRRGSTSRVLLEPWPTTVVEFGGARTVPSLLSRGCAVAVEFWAVDASGRMVSPGNTRLVTTVPADAGRSPITVHGVEVPTLAMLSGRLLHECDFPVDVVYTWVDGSDPEWQAARERRLRDAGSAALDPSASGRARYESRDELRYSMRSVHLFAPWVRRIHLVTAGQTPRWLDVDHPLIELVDHRDILPQDALPTFNSHAIETSLHHIPGLSEQFIYFNDDMFLGRPADRTLFFTPAGAPSICVSSQPLGLEDPDSPTYLQAGYHNRRLLDEALGVTITQTMAHSPYPHRRSILSELEHRFPEAIARTARSPFRSETDVSMLSSLAQHYGLVTGAAVEGTGESAFANLASSAVRTKLTGILRRDQDFFCLGDHHHHGMQPEQLDVVLHEFLEAYLPVAAPWESDPG